MTQTNQFLKQSVPEDTVLQLHRLISLLIDDKHDYASYLSGKLSVERDVFPSLPYERDILNAIFAQSKENNPSSLDSLEKMMTVHGHNGDGLKKIVELRPEGDRVEQLINQLNVYKYHLTQMATKWANSENLRLIEENKLSQAEWL